MIVIISLVVPAFKTLLVIKHNHSAKGVSPLHVHAISRRYFWTCSSDFGSYRDAKRVVMSFYVLKKINKMHVAG